MSRNALHDAMSEAQLQEHVIEAARINGWLIHHVRPAWTAKGYRTPVQGDVGFVDLVLLHWRKGIIFAELKRQKGRLGPRQRDWLDGLAAYASDRVGVYLVRPSDIDLIDEILQRGPREGEGWGAGWPS
jgi:hypothetical protein